MRKNTGFTLIELLVVISIIGVLTSIVLARLSDARRAAQNIKRISEMRQLKIALATYYDINKQYPPNPAGSVCSTCIEGGWSGGEMTPYMRSLPVDPIYGGTTKGYQYAISNPSPVGNGRQSYTMLIYRLKNFSSFCSISTPPGNAAWNFSNGVNYPPCGI